MVCLYLFAGLREDQPMQANNVLQVLPREVWKGSSAPESAVTHLTLRGNAHWSKTLRAKNRLAIQCDEGAVWVTQEGVREDAVLKTGEALQIRGPGLVVVSAFQHAALTTAWLSVAA